MYIMCITHQECYCPASSEYKRWGCLHFREPAGGRGHSRTSPQHSVKNYRISEMGTQRCIWHFRLTKNKSDVLSLGKMLNYTQYGLSCEWISQRHLVSRMHAERSKSCAIDVHRTFFIDISYSRCEVVILDFSKSKMNGWWQSQMMANEVEASTASSAAAYHLRPGSHSLFLTFMLEMSFRFRTIHCYSNILRVCTHTCGIQFLS
jgi:hypothetical protein